MICLLGGTICHRRALICANTEETALDPEIALDLNLAKTFSEAAAIAISAVFPTGIIAMNIDATSVEMTRIEETRGTTFHAEVIRGVTRCVDMSLVVIEEVKCAEILREGHVPEVLLAALLMMNVPSSHHKVARPANSHVAILPEGIVAEEPSADFLTTVNRTIGVILHRPTSDRALPRGGGHQTGLDRLSASPGSELFTCRVGFHFSCAPAHAA